MLSFTRALTRVARPGAASARAFSAAPEHILVSTERDGSVGVITLNRPKMLNALCGPLFEELLVAARAFDEDPKVGAIVVTGSKKAFAAGADIKEMQSKTFAEVATTGFLGGWQEFAATRTPTIAAVNGFALGGGCELAMMCDMMLAGESAKFGQPEIKLGVIPGAGGTQRLTKAIGKAKAMEICLTGKFFSAQDADNWGLVTRVVPDDDVLPEALELAATIAKMGAPSVQLCKEAVAAADELSLAEGLRLERRLFHALFATDDQTEGMSAFIEKREAKFTNQ